MSRIIELMDIHLGLKSPDSDITIKQYKAMKPDIKITKRITLDDSIMKFAKIQKGEHLRISSDWGERYVKAINDFMIIIDIPIVGGAEIRYENGKYKTHPLEQVMRISAGEFIGVLGCLKHEIKMSQLCSAQ